MICRKSNHDSRQTHPMPNTPPRSVTAGTSVQYRRELQYHPADGWAYQLALSVPGFVPAVAEPDGAGFLLTIPASATTSWPAGTYVYSERVTKGGVVHEVGRGSLTVSADVTAVQDDGRSHAQRALAAIEAALEGRLGDGIQNYSIGGRAVSKIPLRELYELRDKYRLQCFVERNRGRFGSTVITFGGGA